MTSCSAAQGGDQPLDFQEVGMKVQPPLHLARLLAETGRLSGVAPAPSSSGSQRQFRFLRKNWFTWLEPPEQPGRERDARKRKVQSLRSTCKKVSAVRSRASSGLAVRRRM